MSESLTQINEYLDYLFVYGSFWVYLVIFSACFIENLIPPFPGDSFIIAGAVLVAVDRLDLYFYFPVVVCGGICSVMLLYLIGRKYGHAFFVRRNYRYFSTADIYRMESSFQRWGPLLLVCSRFVVGARSAVALVVGIGRYPATGMFVYSTISYFLFVGLLTYIAFALVENLDQVETYLRAYYMVVWPVLIGIVLIWIIRRVVRLRRGKTA